MKSTRAVRVLLATDIAIVLEIWIVWTQVVYEATRWFVSAGGHTNIWTQVVTYAGPWAPPAVLTVVLGAVSLLAQRRRWNMGYTAAGEAIVAANLLVLALVVTDVLILTDSVPQIKWWFGTFFATSPK